MIALFLPGAGLVLAAQQVPPGTTTVTLGAVSSPPQGQVMIPVFLTPGSPDTQVGSFSAAIRFETNSLSFVRAEKGFLLDSVNATFHADVTQDDANPGQALVELEVSTGGEEPRPLREGLVLSLVFRVEPDAQPDTTVTLPIDRISASTPGTPSAPVAPLLGREGTVEILRQDAIPFVSCFFFTH